jgi:hypothetical protein
MGLPTAATFDERFHLLVECVPGFCIADAEQGVVDVLKESALCSINGFPF